MSFSSAADSCGRSPELGRNLHHLGKAFASKTAPECQLPRVGTVKDFNLSGLSSPSGIDHVFRLVRPAANSFEIHFNLHFYNDNQDGKITPDPSLTTLWRNKTQTCLMSADGKIRGPNREKIKFRMYDGPNNGAAPPIKYIGMRKTGRARSLSWTESMSCPTILHELLHLTGLVDEYPERAMGYIKDEAGN